MTFGVSSVKGLITAIFDILIMWMVIYYGLRIIRNNQRTVQIFKGILFIIIIDALAKWLGLKTVQFLADMFLNWGFLAVILIFQPEIRAILERIGKSNIFSRMTTLTGDEKEKLVDQIVTAVMLLSKDQTGALISIEQSRPLDDYIATGQKLNADVTAELLTSIFVTSTPLHDGAVIIQGDKIACASAYFPPTNMELPPRYGARHRAAIGISEITDAVTIVVSEETGVVSITEAGRIFQVDRKQLRDYLLRAICGEATEVKSSGKPARKRPLAEKIAVRKQETPEQNEKIETEQVVPAQNTAFVNREDEADDNQKMEELDREAALIKLPHKKDRPTPSYPEQKEKPVSRMSAEDVAKARQANLEKYSHAVPQTPKVITSEEEKKFDTSRIDISKVVGFEDELSDSFHLIDSLPDGKEEKKDE